MIFEDLLYRVCETSHRYLALGNEAWQSGGAAFVRNRATPRRFDANRMGLVRAESAEAVEEVMRELEVAFEGFGHCMVGTDALTPRVFETRLAMEDGYREE